MISKQEHKQYPPRKNSKYNSAGDCVTAWVEGSLSLDNLLKMYRFLRYKKIDMTKSRATMYRTAINIILKIKADILFGSSPQLNRIKESYGEELIERERERNSRPSRRKENKEKKEDLE